MGFTTTTVLGFQVAVPEGHVQEDILNNLSALNYNMGILDNYLGGLASIMTDPTIINTQGKRFTPIVFSTAGSISSISNYVLQVPFTLLFLSTASYGFISNTNFRLAGNFFPTAGSTLSLLWDGTRFVELGRAIAA